MPYATVAHVKARAGFLSDAWTDDTKPGEADLQGFLADVAGEINAALAGLGFAEPAEDTPANIALRGLNADGALLLALDATFPAGEGPDAATELQKAIRERYEKAWERLLDGKHPATTAIDAGSESSVPSATDFWSENPYYGRSDTASEADPPIANENLDPVITRGMVL